MRAPSSVLPSRLRAERFRVSISQWLRNDTAIRMLWIQALGLQHPDPVFVSAPRFGVTPHVAAWCRDRMVRVAEARRDAKAAHSRVPKGEQKAEMAH